MKQTHDIIDNGSFLITEEHAAIALMGHEVKYRISHNEVGYAECVTFCQDQSIGANLVPAPRSGSDAFALSTKVLSTRKKALVHDESWDDGICNESWSVRTLKKGNEYVLIRERIGLRNKKRELEQTPLYRMRYEAGDDGITAEEWCRRFMLRSQGITEEVVGITDDGKPITEPVGPCPDSVLRKRVRMESYNEDEGILDEDWLDNMHDMVRNRFVQLCKCVDEILLRARLKRIFSAHNAIRDPTVKGGVVQIMNKKAATELAEDEVQPHLATLRPFSMLIRHWGNITRPDPTSNDALWADEQGKVDYGSKANLRLTPLVKTETLLDEIADNVEHSVNQSFGELYESIRTVLNGLNEQSLESGEDGSEKRREQMLAHAMKFQKNSEKLFQEVKDWEKQLGRTLTVRTTPYKDQAEDIDARLAAIKPVDQQTAEAMMNLVKKTGDTDKGFDGLGALFG
jgi:hypothetical protein|tara:strand:- start:92 stop:1462 length:1371 start_codon:yes stop_codon:yes gene_type:complete